MENLPGDVALNSSSFATQSADEKPPKPKSYKIVGPTVDLSGLCAFVMPVEPRSQNIPRCVCKSPESPPPWEGYEAAGV